MRYGKIIFSTDYFSFVITDYLFKINTKNFLLTPSIYFAAAHITDEMKLKIEKNFLFVACETLYFCFLCNNYLINTVLWRSFVENHVMMLL